MQITRQSLSAWEAAPGFTAWFDAVFPAGEADYQAVLDALAAEFRFEAAHWLMDRAGPDEESVVELVDLDRVPGAFFAAGSLRVRGDVRVGVLRAGGDISVDGSIETRFDVIASGSVQAWGGRMEAAHGSIRAGLDIHAAGDLVSGGSMHAGGDITGGGDLRADGEVRADGDIAIAGTTSALGGITAGGAFFVDGHRVHAADNSAAP